MRPLASWVRPLFSSSLSGADAVLGTRIVGGTTRNVMIVDVEDVTAGALGFDYDALP